MFKLIYFGGPQGPGLLCTNAPINVNPVGGGGGVRARGGDLTNFKIF